MRHTDEECNATQPTHHHGASTASSPLDSFQVGARTRRHCKSSSHWRCALTRWHKGRCEASQGLQQRLAVVEAERDQWKAATARAEHTAVRLRSLLNRAGQLGQELIQVRPPLPVKTLSISCQRRCEEYDSRRRCYVLWRHTRACVVWARCGERLREPAVDSECWLVVLGRRSCCGRTVRRIIGTSGAPPLAAVAVAMVLAVHWVAPATAAAAARVRLHDRRRVSGWSERWPPAPRWWKSRRVSK
jgi:hypothetical protein